MNFKNNFIDNINLKYNRIILPILGGIFLLLLYIHNVYNAYPIVMSQDEMGYLGNAATLAGLDWKSLGSTSYYSWGYSIFLIPLFKIFSSGIIIYKLTLIINMFFMFGSYVLIFHTLKEVNVKLSILVKTMIAVAICSYGGFLANMKLAWAEASLVFFSWLAFYLFMKFVNVKHYRYLFFSILTVTYMYFIHQRMLGLLVSILCVVILYFIFSNKDHVHIKYKALSLCLLAVLFVLGMYIKKYLQLNFYSTVTLNNDFTKTFNGMTNKFSIINFIETLSGQLFYIFIASYFLIIISVFMLIKKIYNMLKCKMYCEGELYLSIWLILSFASSIIISALFLMKGTRIDHLFYGRYNEPLLSIIAVIGINELFKMDNKSKIRIAAFAYIFSSVLAIISFPKYLRLENAYQTVCATMLYPIYKFFSLKLHVILILSFIIAIIFIVCIYNKYATRFFVIMIIFYNIVAYQVSFSDIESPIFRDNKEISNTINEIKEDYDYNKLYYVDHIWDAAGTMKMLDLKTSIIRVNNTDKISSKNAIILLGNKMSVTDDFLEKFYEIKKISKGALWISKTQFESIKNNKLNKITYSSKSEYYMRNVFAGNYDDVKNEYYSDGTGMMFMYGPYMRMLAGKYVVNYDYTVTQIGTGKIGYFDVYSSKYGELNKINLVITKPGNYKLSFVFNTLQDASDIEFRAYANEGVKMSVNNIEWSRTE